MAAAGEGLPRTRVRATASSDAGQVRTINEDAYWHGEVADRGYLALVADGMGGHQTGEVASRQALRVFLESFRQGVLARGPRAWNALLGRATHPPLVLARAVRAAHQNLRALASERREHQGMGTTLSVLWIDDQVAWLAHVGDSRMYLSRAGALRQLTHDHSWVADRVRQGLLSQEEANRHRWRNVITNALGTQEPLRLDLLACDVQVGDRFLICSDGVAMTINEPRMQQIMDAARNADTSAADALLAEANERGSPDNITAVVLEVERVALRTKAFELTHPNHEPLTVNVQRSSWGASQRAIDERFPRRSTLNRWRKHPWYAYRGWLIAWLAAFGLLWVLLVLRLAES